jgi:exosome complex exonuclease RRP6
MMLDSGRFNRDGHGFDTRYQMRNNSSSYADSTNELEGPSFHIEHPFREEIEELDFKPWQFDLSGIEATELVKSKDVKDEGVWIGTEDDLAQLAKRIVDENVREVAIDLEAHSYRTFAGFVCLIQLSIRRNGDASMNDKESNKIETAHDFLIDALSLRHAISTSFGPILANPNIVKVMHGADSDIPWLQRDFGCYVVNLFDTGRASRALKFPSAGLAYLLRKYANVEADKSHQLADWRRRPLPDDMREYAVSDTRYLLDIYDQLRLELESYSSPDVSIKSVLDRCKDVCLIRYDKEPFRPLGYKFIMDGGKRSRKQGLAPFLKGKHEVTSELSPEQEAALKALFDWRDKTARQEDESVQYVCPNAALLRIASNRPTSVSALQRLVNPPPPLVLRRSQEILEILNGIKTASSAGAAKSSLAAATVQSIQTGKSTTSSDAVPPPPTPSRNREMLSPILGSDMLYEKAGWKSPPLNGNLTSESEDESKRRLTLDVAHANQGYQSSLFSSHSLRMSPGRSFEEKEEDWKKGQRSAQLIRDELAKSLDEADQAKIINGFDVMKYIRPFAFKEKQDNILRDEDDATTPNSSEENKDADDMIIPKSMSEVYSLSNVNRRRTNKDKSPKTAEEKGNDFKAQTFPEDDIQEAEKVLAARGYFGDSKRQKPNNILPGKEGDVELMIKMGWIKDKEEAEALAAAANINPADQGDIEQKKSSDKLGKASGAVNDYYSTMGAGVPVFDPSAAPSNNPFFQGAAAGAASLFTGEKQKNYKPGKRNKKR